MSPLGHYLINYGIYCNTVKYRYLAGQKEFEVELEFSSLLTAYPDRVKTGGEECLDGENPEPGSTSTVGSEEQDQMTIGYESILYNFFLKCFRSAIKRCSQITEIHRTEYRNIFC